MSTTANDIITKRVRKALNDTDSNTNARRWDDPTLILHLSDAQNIIVDQRSEELLDTDGITERTLTEPTTLGDTLFVADKWREALMHYVVARAFEWPGKERLNLDAASHHDELFWKALETL
jgi:hypothetical protein